MFTNIDLLMDNKDAGSYVLNVLSPKIEVQQKRTREESEPSVNTSPSETSPPKS